METSKGAIVNDVAKVLNDAADLIEGDGWCRYQARGLGGERCAAIAIADATTDATTRVTDWTVLRHSLHAFLDHIKGSEIGEWNAQQPGPEPVIAALRSAARSVEGP
jgi:hypothetical protein